MHCFKSPSVYCEAAIMISSQVVWAIDLVKIVVEVWVASTQVSAQQGGVSREHCGHIHLAHPQQDQGNPGQPLVAVQ